MKQCFLVCPLSGNLARKQCFLVCLPLGNLAKKQCFLVYPPSGNQALKYRSVTDIVRPIREIVRRREETTGHSVRPK
jgi:hypothetical protein